MKKVKKCNNIPECLCGEEKVLSLKELGKQSKERIERITHEFENGFKFVKSFPKSVTILGSARSKEDNLYYKRARELSRKICKLGYTIITGGGPGIMEAGNRGAFESCCNSVGINIELPSEQILNPYTTQSMGFHYFFTRKVVLFFSAEAYVFFPGGFGTMDEFFELITLIQTKKIPKVPVILVGKEYWGALDKFIKTELRDKNKTISENDVNIYQIIDNDDEILEILKNTPLRNE